MASYFNVPVFGWVSNQQELDDKTRASTLVRILPPLSGLGTLVSLAWFVFVERVLYLISLSPLVPPVIVVVVVVVLLFLLSWRQAGHSLFWCTPLSASQGCHLIPFFKICCLVILPSPVALSVFSFQFLLTDDRPRGETRVSCVFVIVVYRIYCPVSHVHPCKDFILICFWPIQSWLLFP